MGLFIRTSVFGAPPQHGEVLSISHIAGNHKYQLLLVKLGHSCLGIPQTCYVVGTSHLA